MLFMLGITWSSNKNPSKAMMANKMCMKAGVVNTLSRTWFGHFDNSLNGGSGIILGADDPELENKDLCQDFQEAAIQENVPVGAIELEPDCCVVISRQLV